MAVGIRIKLPGINQEQFDKVNDHVSLTARVENLADQRFQEIFGFGEPGRAVYVGVRLRD